MDYFAHSRAWGDWQLLIDHLTGVSCTAAELGQAAGVTELSRIAALFHDIGKYSPAFQQRLAGSPRRVDHSTAGAQEIMKRFNSSPMAMLLAYCIVGHHGGLPDYGMAAALENDGTLCARLRKAPLKDYSAYREEIDPASIELPPYLAVRPPPPRAKFTAEFTAAFLTRLVFSTLVDADFIDTETFVLGSSQPRGDYANLDTLNTALSQYLSQFSVPTTPINQRRTATLQRCIEMAHLDQGFFTFTLPTGGGKTLSSMAFALNHAVKHNLRRIIYVIPYTSIIEQNAAVFKQALGEANVLEHHANFDWGQLAQKSAPGETTSVVQKLKLAAENWDIPIVVTTNVQFFESLFANRPSRCRKLHNIAKSVVIFDEAQMLPRGFLKPCMAAVHELVRNYNVSTVFCTATQPSLAQFFPDETFMELSAAPEADYAFYKRVDAHILGQTDDAALIAEMLDHDQALCIVNTRRHALGLFTMLVDHVLEPEAEAFHLSTLMCPVHRKATIATIRQRLHDEQSCFVISTQILEAGVDLDFPVGFRAMAGLDSIVQAAGRVNREGRQERGDLFVFESDSEFVTRVPAWIAQCAGVARSTLGRHRDDPISLAAIEDYFELLHTVQSPRAYDEKQIMACFEKGTGEMAFDFKTAAERFRIIEDNTLPVLIPYDATAQRLIDQLKTAERPTRLLRQLQLYTVNIYEREFEALQALGLIDTYVDTYAVLNDMSQYDPKTGIVIPDSAGGDGIFL
jgi:CRISPR-associated endonuclease/helicase Cas3